jgi:hypothetical protein
VAPDVGERNGDAELEGAPARGPALRGLGVALPLVAEDLEADEAHNARGAIAVGAEFLVGGVRRALEVHLHPSEEVVEVLERDRVTPDRVEERRRERVVRGRAVDEAPQAVELRPGPGRIEDGIVDRIDGIVRPAAERVDGVDAAPPLGRQEAERVEEGRPGGACELGGVAIRGLERGHGASGNGTPFGRPALARNSPRTGAYGIE